MDNFAIRKIKHFKFDSIFHFASLQIKNNLDFIDFHNGNVIVTTKIINIINNLSFKNFIYVSTTSVFSKSSFDSKGFLSHDSFCDPINNYGLSKYISEKILEFNFQKIKPKLFIVRLPSLFGHNHNGGIIYDFISMAQNSINIELFNQGKVYRNFLYVADAINLLNKLIIHSNKLDKNEFFVFGCKKSLMLNQIASEIIKLTKSKSKIILSEKIFYNHTDVKINNSKVISKLKLHPADLKESLKKYIKSFN